MRQRDLGEERKMLIRERRVPGLGVGEGEL